MGSEAKRRKGKGIRVVGRGKSYFSVTRRGTVCVLSPLRFSQLRPTFTIKTKNLYKNGSNPFFVFWFFSI